MTPDQIARRYENLPGYELLDYAEAAVPLWQLNVEAVSVIRRGLQPIKEFILRSLEAGLEAGNLPGFLGLDESIVKGGLLDLVADKFVSTADGVTAVTELGRKALKEGYSTPTEEILPILFDGITRRVVGTLSIEIVSPRDVEEGAVAEIPATPANQPVIKDLILTEVDRVLAEQFGGRSEVSRDILRLKRIARYRRVFRRVVALVFRSSKGEIKTRFIVDGVPDEGLEQRFAEHGGNIRKGLVRSFGDRYIQSSVRSHLGNDAARRVLDQSEYVALQKQVSVASHKLASLRRRETAAVQGEIPKDQTPSDEDLRVAIETEAAARQELTLAPVRPAAVYEMAELLRRGVEEVRSNLSISTRGLAPHVVDKVFLKRLEHLAKRGVQISITMNEDAADWRSRGRDWAKALDGLNELARRFPGTFVLKNSKEKRYFYLSWDNELALVANRPMLSNYGKIRSFDQFAGFVIQDQDLIAAYLARANR
ncbi:hypothetical protein GGE50_003813 [Rhizobium leguminosarum]|uniref:hypothetical protein n=1 Tax=Rhizobium leguminosarum TaxID=384 RepID=UPI001617C94A|nr:hypothetical protein [Rhizobium leguminosarum]MBB4587909.1 hypothetical protein [Rhizobium leguminosarum]